MSQQLTAKRSVMSRWAKANPGDTDLVSVNVRMTDDEARMLARELEDVAQAFPDPGLLQGDTPYGRLYRALKALKEATS